MKVIKYSMNNEYKYEAEPRGAEEQDVLRLREGNHLAFQPEAANLCSCQLVLTLSTLHIQQTLL